jgi:hypothetical protein
VKRRQFLAFLGLAPAAPLLAKAIAEPASVTPAWPIEPILAQRHVHYQNFIAEVSAVDSPCLGISWSCAPDLEVEYRPGWDHPSSAARPMAHEGRERWEEWVSYRQARGLEP